MNKAQLLEFLHEQIDIHVRCGYRSEAEVMETIEEQVRDEFRESGDAMVEPLLAEARQRLHVQKRREQTWSERTANDRLDSAFEALRGKGIIALQDAGYTMSDGWSDVAEAHAYDDDAWGATFFHRQDVERGVQGDGLHLAYGAFVEGDAHEPESIRLGHEICAVLREHGLEVEWNGSISTRIQILPFEWQKRRWTPAPS
ncbi:MAG: hypothetical protein AAF799_15365 [Myxococcota bacterium]